MKRFPAKLSRAWSSIATSGVLRYLGPTVIVSTAYIDPSNFGTDIAAGAVYAYDILWLVWLVLLASIMAMVLQYLSSKLGIATGQYPS